MNNEIEIKRLDERTDIYHTKMKKEEYISTMTNEVKSLVIKMKYWFSSDTHFGHENIIKYTGRPFKTLEEMDNKIIENFNARVTTDDSVIFLGDFCFKNTVGGKKGEGTTTKSEEYLNRLNGRWSFVKGNHDSNNGVKAIISSCIINYGGQEMFCCHNPAEANHKFRINLCGHIHELWKFKKLAQQSYIVNVGVDVWKFKPVSISEILKELDKFKKGTIDELGNKKQDESLKTQKNETFIK